MYIFMTSPLTCQVTWTVIENFFMFLMEIVWEEKWWWDKSNGKCISEGKIFETQRDYKPRLGNIWRWKVYFQSKIVLKMFVFTLFSCSSCCFSFFKQAFKDIASSPEGRDLWKRLCSPRLWWDLRFNCWLTHKSNLQNTELLWLFP